MRPRRWTFLLCFLGLVCSPEILFAQAIIPQPRITQAIDESNLTILKGNTHPLAQAQFDRGAAPGSLALNRMLLVLQRSPEQEAALRQLLDDQQDKSSPNYHKWLTPAQFGQQFGPADQDVQTVTAWLQLHGFQVAQVSNGRTVIEFSGTAGQVQEAFHTSIHKYVVNGEEHWANASDPQIPTALTPVVRGVWTLHNFLKKPLVHLAELKIPAKLVPGAPGKPPLVTFPDNPPLHALGPADYATIYNIAPLYTQGINGTGITIAVVARSDTYNGRQDIGAFLSTFGLSAVTPVSTPDGPDPGDLGGGEELEATLDASWAVAIAPGATVRPVVSASTNTSDGADLSELYIIDNNVGNVMTESFGGCEADVTSAEATSISQLAEQAAAQGITYIVSAGDSGAEGCDNPNTESTATGPLSVNVLASTPFTVAAGGTMFNENGQDSQYWSSTNGTGFESALSYIPENAWNESCAGAQCGTQGASIWAGGGGASMYFAKPAWQAGVAGIPQDGFRDVPDISLTSAQHDPYLICLEGSCTPDSQGDIFLAAVYGTSAAAPSFAGIMALVDQKNSSSQGQANYVLYRLAAGETLSQCNGSASTTPPAAGCIFNDVTQGNNAVPGESGYGTSTVQYKAGVGYDLATGLGSVNVANLVNQWTTVAFKPTTTTITSLSPLVVTHGQPVNIAVTVTAATGTPSGSVVLLGNFVSTGPFELDSTGTFSGTVNSFPGGGYRLTAQYSGDGTFAPSASAPSPPFLVNAENTVTTLSVLAPNSSGNLVPFVSGPYGTFVYLREDVKPQSGIGTVVGEGEFLTDNLQTFGELNSLGYWTQGVTTLSPGTHSLTAQYLWSEADFFSSTSSATQVTITQAPTSTNLTATPTSTGFALTATVNTQGGGVPPGGTVTFFANNSQLSQSSLTPISAIVNPQFGIAQTAAATAGFTTGTLAGTAYTFTAVYSGDGNYLTSSSLPLQETVQPNFQLSFSPSSPTIPAPGGSVLETITASAEGGFTGTLNFTAASCSGLPAESGCSFNPPSVTGGGSTQLTIATTAPHAAPARGPQVSKLSGWTTGLGTSLLAVLLFSVPSKRRRWRGVISLIALAFLLTLPSCGGGSGGGGGGGGFTDPGTPVGTTLVTVTVTSGTITHSINFVLDVQ